MFSHIRIVACFDRQIQKVTLSDSYDCIFMEEAQVIVAVHN